MIQCSFVVAVIVLEDTTINFRIEVSDTDGGSVFTEKIYIPTHKTIWYHKAKDSNMNLCYHDNL
jgi:hypothetical protein